MADFVAVLKKTLEGIGNPTPETRQRVYERARATVMSKLQALSPPPPQAVADKQIKALEDAIGVIERGYAPPPKKHDPLDELEDVFASLNGLRERTTIAPRAAPTDDKALPKGPFTSQISQRPASPPPVASPPSPAAKPPARPAQEMPQPVRPDMPRPETPAAPPPKAAAPMTEPADEFEPAADTAEMDYGADDGLLRRRRFGPAIAAVLALAVLAGGAYAVWLNKDDFSRMVGLTPPDDTVTQPLQDEPAATETASQTAVPAEPAVAATPGTGALVKLTQRLNADGSEVDPGPAGGASSVGEGTSVAEVSTGASVPSEAPTAAEAPAAAVAPQAALTPQDDPAAASSPRAAAPSPDVAPDETADPPADAAATDPATAAAAPGAAAPSDTTEPPAATDPASAQSPPAPAVVAETAAAVQPGLAVGQKAIFYEERTSSAQGSAEPGTTVWSVVQESPGGERPPEPAIRAETTIPGKDVQLRMTIRRNADPTLPASHIVEMIFLTPESFDGGGVANVLRIAMKSSEQDAGNPLIGIPAKIADGFFLVALNDNKAEIDANMNLLLRQSWIDIPIVYGSGRRALITMEKGIPGAKVFDEALKAWGVSTAG